MTLLCGAPSVGAIATAALEQGPNGGPKWFVYVRAKEGLTGLVPRRSLELSQSTTHLDLAKCAVRFSSVADWGRLRSYPIAVEAFSDHSETGWIVIVVATGARPC